MPVQSVYADIYVVDAYWPDFDLSHFEHALAWFREKGTTDLPYPRFAPGADARFEIDETLDLSEGVHDFDAESGH